MTDASKWPDSRERSEERRVGKSVDLGGRRIIKKKKREADETAPRGAGGPKQLRPQGGQEHSRRGVVPSEGPGPRPPLGFFFFFSSRRRHTRCSRDWSSDVCSSDL